MRPPSPRRLGAPQQQLGKPDLCMRVIGIRRGGALERLDGGAHAPGGERALRLLVGAPRDKGSRTHVARMRESGGAVEPEQVGHERAERRRVGRREVARSGERDLAEQHLPNGVVDGGPHEHRVARHADAAPHELARARAPRRPHHAGE